MTQWITVTLAQVKGSAPRGAGTSMRIFAEHQTGTIGGGRLEWEATQIARQMLKDGKRHDRRAVPLGPDLGQCCGGAVVLEFRADAPEDAPATTPLWVWGAGHVGRAIVQVITPLQAHAITWIDTAQTRFPEDIPDMAVPLIAADPPRAVPHAPSDAHHLILTYSHEFDLALCDALLRHGFATAGLIGSATKWARFAKRLRALGHSDARIARITCPIGDPGLGKHPQAIAVGVAAQLLSHRLPARARREQTA